MEFVFYPVLILALISVAGFMLYVRFSASQEKALHHSPLSIASEEAEESHSEAEAGVAVVEEDENEDLVPNELPAIRADAIQEEKEDIERKSEYLDELQEAAAGLAMLMRSSASNRTTPVVFAPEEETESSEDVQTEISEAEEEPEVVSEVEVEEEIVSLPEKKTLAMLLGDDVAEQFDKIDSDLDALENLVVNIESGLSALGPVADELDVSDEVDELTEAA